MWECFSKCCGPRQVQEIKAWINLRPPAARGGLYWTLASLWQTRLVARSAQLSPGSIPVQLCGSESPRAYLAKDVCTSPRVAREARENDSQPPALLLCVMLGTVQLGHVVPGLCVCPFLSADSYSDFQALLQVSCHKTQGQQHVAFCVPFRWDGSGTVFVSSWREEVCSQQVVLCLSCLDGQLASKDFGASLPGPHAGLTTQGCIVLSKLSLLASVVWPVKWGDSWEVEGLNEGASIKFMEHRLVCCRRYVWGSYYWLPSMMHSTW